LRLGVGLKNSFSAKQEVSMAGPKIYGNDEERILRRIGAAVVVLWKDFPESQQSRIIRQAVSTPDRVRAIQLNEQITAFIRNRQKLA
jgi:hypothetical protein